MPLGYARKNLGSYTCLLPLVCSIIMDLKVYSYILLLYYIIIIYCYLLSFFIFNPIILLHFIGIGITVFIFIFHIILGLGFG